MEPQWDFTTVIVPEEQNGELLTDAKFARNLLINEAFNIELTAAERPIGNITTLIRNGVLSGTHEFNAVFMPGAGAVHSVGNLATEGMLLNLNDVPELNLSMPWWNQRVLAESRIGGDNARFFAVNDVSIVLLQSPRAVFFNEDMAADLGLEAPYQLVRDGKWTLDAMHGYMRQAATLNSDTAFRPFLPGGTSVYGLSSANRSMGEMLRGSVNFVETDAAGTPVFVANTPRFFTAVQALADIIGELGMFSNGDGTATFHYERVFIEGRALFCYAELKAGVVYRPSEMHFGILPTPKLDEYQEYHVHLMMQQAPVFVIPTSDPDPAKTGVIMDALAYVSHRDVTPVFFDQTLSIQQLRNEESIEMLQIIRDTAILDIGRIYGWTNSFHSNMYARIVAGDGAVASVVEQQGPAITAAIERTLDAFANMAG